MRRLWSSSSCIVCVFSTVALCWKIDFLGLARRRTSKMIISHTHTRARLTIELLVFIDALPAALALIKGSGGDMRFELFCSSKAAATTSCWLERAVWVDSPFIYKLPSKPSQRVCLSKGAFQSMFSWARLQEFSDERRRTSLAHSLSHRLYAAFYYSEAVTRTLLCRWDADERIT